MITVLDMDSWDGLLRLAFDSVYIHGSFTCSTTQRTGGNLVSIVFAGGVSSLYSLFCRLQMRNLDFLVEAVGAGEAFGVGISTGVGRTLNLESGKAEIFFMNVEQT